MDKKKQKTELILILILSFIQFFNFLYAGPPFITDDPEPVELNHWEFYMSSSNTYSKDIHFGTLPHFEVNYGAFKNTQVHLIVPFEYKSERTGFYNYSYSATELGVKYRFIEETDIIPQVGTFPIIQLPTSFSIKEIQYLLPIWIQKSFGNFSTYGGFGYNINPGINNLNWISLGWQFQYKFSEFLSQGIEIVYHTKQTNDVISQTSANYGGFLNFNQNFHVLYSVGHNLTGIDCYILYFGFLLTI